MTTEVAGSLLELLDDAHVPYELIAHARTETAAAEAEAVGIRPTAVAKTIVLRTPGGFVRAVLPASRRLDLHELRRLVGSKDVRLASEELLAEEYPEFELGAVPPVGGAHHDRVLVDRHVLEEESVTIEAGTHERSVQMKTADLLTVTDAELGDFADE